MFDRILFYYNSDGEFLGDTPLELTAAQCSARSFKLLSTPIRGRSEWPGLYVLRDYRSAKKDPYNDGDDRPAALLLRLANPQIEFVGDSVSVEGLESPNLCWAGLMRPPFHSRRRPGVAYADASTIDRAGSRPIEYWQRQRIVLLPKEGR